MKMTNDTFNAIEALDLEPIKIKLRHHSGEGWSEARADAIEKEYRRFLFLLHTYRGEASSPTADVDIFWHYHILDTMKYAADCEQAFGYFMHHYPFVGLLEGDEEGLAEAMGNRTAELYEATFGEAYTRAESYGSDGAGIDAHRTTADSPQFKGDAGGAANAARCTTWCATGKPKAVGANAARCTTWCAAGNPKAADAKGARYTWSTVATPVFATLVAYHCQSSILPRPVALLEATRLRQVAG